MAFKMGGSDFFGIFFILKRMEYGKYNAINIIHDIIIPKADMVPTWGSLCTLVIPKISFFHHHTLVDQDAGCRPVQ